MTRACALAIAVVWFAAAARTAIAASAEDVRASVELFVNEVSCGDVIILLRDRTPWVPIEALRNAGLRVEGDARDPAYVSLENLIAYRFDEQELQLRLTARPDQFQRHVLPVRTGAPADLIRARNSSAFLNYAAFVDTDGSSGRRAATIATDAGISVNGALIRFGGGRDATGRAYRSPSHLTLDDETHLVRWDVGDTIAPGGLASATRPILGVSVSREFGIDPYFVRYTPLTLNGTAATPSIAEVYINGQLVHREHLAPGSFTLTGLSASIGAGQAEVVLRDTFGREQHLTSTFYEPASLLRPGLQQFHYSLGLQRDDTRLFHYEGPTASATHRVGLTSYLTTGLSANASRNLLNLEPEIATRLPLGELATRLATTRVDRRTTTNWLTSWSYRGHRLSTAVAWRAGTSPRRQLAASTIAMTTAASSDATLTDQSEVATASAAVGAPQPPQLAASTVATPSAASSDAALTAPRHQLDAQIGWAVGRGISMSVSAIDGWQMFSISAPASRRGGVMVSAGRARFGGARGTRCRWCGRCR